MLLNAKTAANRARSLLRSRSTPSVKSAKLKSVKLKSAKSKSIKAKKTQLASRQPDTDALSLKERLAQRRKAARLCKELISFAIFSAFFAVLLGALLGLVGGLKAAAAGVMGVMVLAFSFKYPRYALWAFLVYLPFGGTITYAIGNSPLLQLAKDGFYLPALFGLIQYCRRERLPLIVPKQLTIPLGILLFFCTLTLFLVNGYQQVFDAGGEKPIAMGILGLKVLVGYLPLISCGYYLIRDQKDLLILIRLTSILFIVCCGLALMQYGLLLTGYCAGTRFEVGDALFKASIDAKCFVGGALLYSPQQGAIRLPGTFVAPWQWGWFLISGAFLTFASAFSDPKPTWRTVGLVALGLDFILAVISGQRIALALVPTIAGILLLLTGQVTNLKRFIPVAIGLSLLLGIAALKNPETLQERLNSLIGRWNAAPPYAFIQEQFAWAMQGYHLLGHGLGRATNSARALGKTELIETYYPKLLYEMGPLGMMAFLILVTVLTTVTFKLYRRIRDRNLRSYGAALWLFVAFISYNTYYYPLDVDPVAVYYWFFAGVLLKLPEIEALSRADHTATATSQPHRSKPTRQRPGFA